MKLKYICSYWGREGIDADRFVEMALEAGYDGVEVKVPEDITFQDTLLKKVKEYSLIFIALHWLENISEPPSIYKKKAEGKFS